MPEKRPYKMKARGAAAEQTRERVLDAAVDCFGSRAYDAVSLQDVAQAAGVSLQTVIRVKRSKEELFLTAAERITSEIVAKLPSPSSGDPKVTLEFLMDAYEIWGDHAMRLLIQEDRIPAIRASADRNRNVQQIWIETLFAEQLAELPPATRRRRVAALLAVAGVRAWHVLRRVHGLSKRQTTLAVWELVAGLMGL